MYPGTQWSPSSSAEIGPPQWHYKAQDIYLKLTKGGKRSQQGGCCYFKGAAGISGKYWIPAAFENNLSYSSHLGYGEGWLDRSLFSWRNKKKKERKQPIQACLNQPRSCCSVCYGLLDILLKEIFGAKASLQFITQRSPYPEWRMLEAASLQLELGM